MRRIALALLIPFAVALPAHAQTVPAEPQAVTADVLDTATVHAPGPGMWKVTRGDHTMWILGRVSPLPAGMVWNAARVRSVIASADEVVAEPAVMVDADIGFFGKLALLPSLVGIRDLPDDRQLRDVLPAASYTRWSGLKQRYLGNESKVEHWRPIFAAGRLYDEALADRHLSRKALVGQTVAELLKSRDMKPVSVAARLKIGDPKKALRDFKGTQLADLRCFDRVLDHVDRDLDVLDARAQAWAAGDVATLRSLDRDDPADACEDALLSGAFAQKYGLDTLQAQARSKWMAEVESSLASHRVTFATLPMHEVLSGNGLVAALASKGYRVEAPEAAPAAAAVSSGAGGAPGAGQR